MKRIDVKTAAQRLCGARDALILTHKNPDGDTLGAAFALWDFFRVRGVRAAVKCSDEIPSIYAVVSDEYARSAQEFEPSFVIALDCSDERRLGRYSDVHVALCVDHHGSQNFFADETLLDEGRASCSEIMLDIFDEIGFAPTKYMADCLYMGAATDTGCFRFANTEARTHTAAARLIEAGASAYDLNVIFFMTRSARRVEVEREIFNTLDIRCGGAAAFVVLSREFLEKSGAEIGDLEGISDIPLTIEGVSVGVTIRQQSDCNKVSLRTRGVDACEICALFGGGGHYNASGFETAEMTADEIISALEREISLRLKRD